MSLISEKTRYSFSQVISGLSESQVGTLDKVLDEISARSSKWAKTHVFAAPAKKVDAIIIQKTPEMSPEARIVFRRALVARLALKAEEIVPGLALPDSVLSLYPLSFNRLARYLEGNITGLYDHTDDCFCKDIRFVLLMTVPCGALVVDLISYVPLSSVILSVLRSRSLAPLAYWIKVGGSGTWFRIHADSRYLDEFNEPGWESCYKRIAEMLARRKNIRGLAGTSWFYDPKVMEISPRLAYLRQRPLERGGFFMRHGTGRIHVERATKTSITRRRLYEKGEYIPVCYTMLWPRKELIAWAESAS